MSYRIKETNEMGAGDKCTVKRPSHRYILVDHISPRVPRGVLETVLSLSSLAGSHLVPTRCLLLLQGAASSLEVIVLIWRGVCPARLGCFLRTVSVPVHKDVIDHSCPFLISRWLQERMARNKRQQVQNGDGGASFSLAFSEFEGPSKESVLFSKSNFITSYIWTSSKLKLLCLKVKREPTEWEKTLTTHVPDKGLESGIHKELKLSTKQLN
jgi:hypothetical protein